MHYGVGSSAFILHHALGWLAHDATHSLAVHPYQAYESLALFGWAALLPRLARHLRSEGGVLGATITFDLALRSQLDGLRAMINVPWALERSVFALPALQTFLFMGALLAALVTVLTVRRARGAQPIPATGPSQRELQFGRLLWVYLTLLLCTWLLAGQTTIFLRQLSVSVLLAASIAMWPSPMGTWSDSPRARAASVTTLLVVSISCLAAFAQSSGAAARLDLEHWSYRVDREHGALLREKPRDRLWLGAELGGGTDHFRVGHGCNGDYDIYDRRTLGGAVRAEWEHPLSKHSVLWTGLRLGTVSERIRKDVYREDGVQLEAHDLSVTSPFGQTWVEWEHPNFTLGLSALGCRRFFADDVRLGRPISPRRFCAIPGGHLRGGFSFLAAEVGLLDRQSPLGVPQGRIGVSGMLFRRGTEVQHPDAVLVRYFAGAQLYPGAHFGLVRPHPSLSLEGTLRGQHGAHVLGGDIFLGEQAQAIVLRYRMSLLDW